MASFQLPSNIQESGKIWGPSTSHVSEQFKDIPYAPYSKSDKLGRIADWNELGDGRTAAVGTSGTGGAAGGRAGTGFTPRYAGAGGRSQPQAYGAGATNTFNYFHVEDEATFSVVDSKATAPRRGGAMSRGGRGGAGGAGRGGLGGAGRTGAGRGAATRGYPSATGRGGSRPQMGRGGGGRGWRDWDKPSRVRESSVTINPEWPLLEEIEFNRLSKLRLEVKEPETLSTHGKLYLYDKAYDRITTKAEKPLQIMDRIRYNPTTSDDIIIQQLATENKATVFATDNVLSLLMTAPRSVYSWDIVIVREGNQLYFDKRDDGAFDYVTVNENAADPPMETGEKDAINAPGSLSLEATFVDHNFSFQSVVENKSFKMENPANPFHSPDQREPLASCAYRYRLFDLSIEEDESPIKLALRTQVDAFTRPEAPGGKPVKGKEQFLTLKTLFEFDSRAQGAGNAPDWRTKLDSQRGAVVSTEMRNNSAKLAKWVVGSILAGADAMKIGYVSRANPRETGKHVILSTQTVRPKDFAGQLNVSLANGWGIVRTIADLCMAQPEGKYLLVKDPNKPVIRLYSVPPGTFGDEDAYEPEGGDGDEADE
ncbi:translation initiation factor eIF-3, subunit D [Clavulina sp. PMI_390]|nr:translation initiation factor eIF-3, subunit D [Clavulina sp. PMI_390]